jgi:DNA polymerase-4
MANSRIIFHIDVNSAFLSWSALERLKADPNAVDLRTIPSAVGGDVETRHGIITAKSIPAKKYGVTTGEPVMRALQKCPNLVLVRSDFSAYRRYSRSFIALLRSYTPLVQQISIDEAWLDVTGLLLPPDRQDLRKSAVALGRKIADHVRSQLGFTVNVGISTNKLLAKMASDFEKPDRVHTLFPDEVPEKLWPLPIRSLYGCGAASADKLTGIGIRTIGECAAADPKVLRALLGEKAGVYMHNSSNGIGGDIVRTEKREAKSCSNETTTDHDITASSYAEDVPPIVTALSEKVAARLQKDELYASVVTVSVKTDSFQRRSRQTRLASPANDAKVLCAEAMNLLDALLNGPDGLFRQGAAIRLIGVGTSGLSEGTFRQVSLTEAMDMIQKKKAEAKKTAASAQKQKRLDEMQEAIRKRFGQDAIHKGNESSHDDV